MLRVGGVAPRVRFVRRLAGAAKVVDVGDGSTKLTGPSVVARDAPLVEMGVRYEPHTPSPMESVLADKPIVVDGLMVQTGGGDLGFPKQYIRLSSW